MATATFQVAGVPVLSDDSFAAIAAELARDVGIRMGSYARNAGVTASRGSASGFVRANIVGGAAGNLTVTGITTRHKIAAVVATADAGQASQDLTAEFTITAADTINNTGGTSTAANHVVVVYYL